MRARVLGAESPASLRQAIDRLVRDGEAERQELEFKGGIAEIADNRKLAERIAGMANGGGGVIIFGIGERGSRAVQLNPFTLEGQEERLRQIVNAHVRPYLRAKIHAVHGDAAGVGFVVLEIPPSSATPHAVAVNDRLGFPKREHTVLHWMTETDIERAYRERRERLLERSHGLDRLQQAITDYPGPAGFWLAAVPQTTRVVLPPLHEALETAKAKVFLREQGLDSHWDTALPENVRVGFRRLEFATEWRHGWPQAAWCWFQRDGEYVAWRPGRQTSAIYRDGAVPSGCPPEFFAAEGLLAAVTGCLGALRCLAETFRLTDALDLRCGLKVRSGLLLWQADARDRDPEGHLGSTQESVSVATVLHTEELFVGRAMVAAAKRILDDLASAFGVSEFDLLDASGSVRLARFNTDWRERARKWAQHIGAHVE